MCFEVYACLRMLSFAKMQSFSTKTLFVFVSKFAFARAPMFFSDGKFGRLHELFSVL